MKTRSSIAKPISGKVKLRQGKSQVLNNNDKNKCDQTPADYCNGSTDENESESSYNASEDASSESETVSDDDFQPKKAKRTGFKGRKKVVRRSIKSKKKNLKKVVKSHYFESETLPKKSVNEEKVNKKRTIEFLSSSGSDSDDAGGSVVRAPAKKKSKQSSDCLEQNSLGSHRSIYFATDKPVEEDNPTDFNWQTALSAIERSESSPSKLTEERKAKGECLESDDESDDENEDDWEEVENFEEKSKRPSSSSPSKVPKKKHVIPSSIEITLENEGLKKKCKKLSLAEVMKREMNKIRREVQEDLHKVHVLCLLSHGMYLNRVCEDRIVKCLAASIVWDRFSVDDFKDFDVSDIQRFIAWFKRRAFNWDGQWESAGTVIGERKIMVDLFDAFSSRRCDSAKILVAVLVVCLRCLISDVRLVIAFNTLPLKPPPEKSSKSGTSSTVESKPKVTNPKKQKTKLSSDSDFVEESPRKKIKKKEKGESSVTKKKPENRKIISSESETEEGNPASSQLHYWVEVYSPGEKRWICIDYFKGLVDDPAKTESTRVSKESPRLLYVLAFNPDGTVKDVASRYDSTWCTTSRKFRVSKTWWEDVLKPWKTRDLLKDAEEDDKIKDKLLSLPMPVKIENFKNHPLYALRRHLLKYEIIYPDTAVPLGYVNKTEPIYARECVQLCHTRESWLKEARVIRIGEEPAKKVKAMLSMKRKALGLTESESMVELYGRWQTEPYVPPIAKDGIVPKNEFGNVELFKMCMLPVGCQHVQLPGLGKLARKLGIDVAQAMVGWEFHAGGRAYPILDGWVVCKEHVLLLHDAWAAEEFRRVEKEAAEKSKRAVANWRRLVKGLLIKARVVRKYGLHGDEEASAGRVSSIAREMAARMRKEK